MTRRGVVGLMLAAGSSLLAGCGVFPDRYRYRMTVEVETPQGLKVGSAVREVSYIKQWIKLPDSSSVQVTQHGEAVAVDLPGDKVLFALLPVDGYEPLQAAFGDDAPATLRAARNAGHVAELTREGGSARDQSGYPRLVTFGALGDPISVAAVAPGDLTASFGAGVRLRRITVRMTDEAVTVGIEKRLGWLVKLHGGYLDGGFTSRNAPLGLHGGFFSSELFK